MAKKDEKGKSKYAQKADRRFQYSAEYKAWNRAAVRKDEPGMRAGDLAWRRMMRLRRMVDAGQVPVVQAAE